METQSNNQDSSSSNPNKNFKNLEEELIYQINDLRFHSRQFMQNIASHILTHNDAQNLIISFPDLNRSVHYTSPQNLTNFTEFLQQNMSTNQILQDFTFPPKLNEYFISGFSRLINQNKALGLNEGNIKLKLEIPSKLYYGYYLENIPIKKMQSVLGFIIFEEYITLTTKIKSDPQDLNLLKPNFFFEYNDNGPIEYIPFLSNIYNTILIYPEQVTEDQTLHNLYILLLSEAIDEDPNPNKKEVKQRNSNTGELPKEKRKSTYYSAVGNVSSKIPLIPDKYRNLWSTHLQVPLKSVEKLVKAMDSNNDMKVTLCDIINFSYKRFIHLNEEVYEGMVLEAAKNRRVLFPKEKELETFDTMPPLTVEEIHKALTIHLKKDGARQREVYKPYFDVWLMFLNEIGEKNLRKPFLEKEIPQPILDQSDEFRKTQLSKANSFKWNSFKGFASQTMRSGDNLTKSALKIKDLKSKCFVPPYRPEAGIIINNTENIQEVVVEREVEEKPKNSDEFAKTINGQFLDPLSTRNNDYKSVTFYTQKYYQEALRLSKHPEVYQKAEKNPIITFIPENFDFVKTTTKEKEKPVFVNKKSSVISAIFPATISYISDKKEIMDFENQEEEFDKISTINNINQIPPIMKPPTANNALRAKTTTFRRNVSTSLPRPRIHNYDRNGMRLFNASFKPEDCETLKKKLSTLEPIVDKYAPPSAHQFRDDIPNEKNVLFETRFKCLALENPYNMSQHDLRPKEALDKEEKLKKMKEREQQEHMSRFLGMFVANKEWKKYFRRADLHRKEGFIDHKHPEFILMKGGYHEPTQIMNNLLRGETEYDENFKLFHRSLRSTDKNLFFGQNKGSK